LEPETLESLSNFKKTRIIAGTQWNFEPQNLPGDDDAIGIQTEYAYTYSHLVNINKKTCIQNWNNFFISNNKTFPSSEGSNSSLAQSAGELQYVHE